MTSKNSSIKLFWKMFIQDVKKRLWYPITLFIAFFMLMEVPLLMKFDNMTRNPKGYIYSKAYYFANNFMTLDSNILVTGGTIVAAIVCGLSAFAYLHSRQQLDTYHSMPVKRELLFNSKFFAGVVYYLITILLHIAVCTLIAISNDAMSVNAWNNVLGMLGIQILIFLIIYGMTVVAIMLTGNIFISFLGTVVLMSYSYLMTILKTILYGRYFHTALVDYLEPVWAFSPLHIIINICEAASNYRTLNFAFSYYCILKYVPQMIVFVVIEILLSLFLYKKRSTEAAGKPIAFGVSEPVIKSMIVIPVALISGYIIENMISRGYSFGWYIFGVVFGFLASCILMEIIFRANIREAFHHWQHIAFNAVCVALIVTIFKGDVLGYNAYMPTENEVDYYAVSIKDVLDVYSNTESRNRNQYITATEYRMENMKIKDNDSIYKLAQKAAEENLYFQEYTYYDGIENTPEYIENREKEKNYRVVIIAYNLKNGKQIFRQYVVDLADAETKKLMADIFNDTDYKLNSMPAFNDGWSRELLEIECINEKDEKEIKLTEEQKNQLMNIYQSEYMNLTFEDIENTNPIGIMNFVFSKNDNNDKVYEGNYVIYPQFVRTIALIKECGFDFNDLLEAEDILKISVKDYTKTDEEEYKWIEYTDAEQITEILNRGIWSRAYYISLRSVPTEDYYVYITYIDSEGEKRRVDYEIKKDMTPQFMIDDLNH